MRKPTCYLDSLLPFSHAHEMPLCVYKELFSSVADSSRFPMHIQSVVTQSHVGRRREFIFSGKRRGGKRKIGRMEAAAARDSRESAFVSSCVTPRNPPNEIIPMCVQRAWGRVQPQRTRFFDNLIWFESCQQWRPTRSSSYYPVIEPIPFAVRKWSSSSTHRPQLFSFLFPSFFFSPAKSNDILHSLTMAVAPPDEVGRAFKKYRRHFFPFRFFMWWGINTRPARNNVHYKLGSTLKMPAPFFYRRRGFDRKWCQTGPRAASALAAW